MKKNFKARERHNLLKKKYRNYPRVKNLLKFNLKK